MRRYVIGTAFALLLSTGQAAHAQRSPEAATWPAKAVRLVVPYAPGGPTDTLARLVGRRLTERLGQQFVIDNRAGANGIIAAEIVAKAPADGYTLLLGNSGVLTSNPALYARLPYDPLKDYAPVAVLAAAPLMLIAHPSLGVADVAGLIRLARSRPGELSFASGGTGGVAHLAGELLNHETGIRTVHIAYKGAAPAVRDLLAGEVAYNFTSTVTALPHVKAGRLRGLAVTTAKRAPALPAVPAIAETVPGYEVSPWYGIVLPANAPKPVIDALNAAILAVLAEPEVRKRIASTGGQTVGGTPAAYTRLIESDLAKWTRLARSANLKLD